MGRINKNWSELTGRLDGERERAGLVLAKAATAGVAAEPAAAATTPAAPSASFSCVSIAAVAVAAAAVAAAARKITGKIPGWPQERRPKWP